MANIDIKEPEDFKLYFHTSREENVWLDGKGKPICLDQPLVTHVDSIHLIELWNSRSLEKTLTPRTLSLEREGPTIALQLIKTHPTSTPHYPHNGDYNQYAPIRWAHL